MKITAISLCGTYPSWTHYAIGSVYNSVDEIIVVNSGYFPSHPELGCKFPEKYNREQLEKFPDKDKKLLVFNGIDHFQLDKRYRINYHINEFGRSGNAVFASRLAWERGADWILHVASDQIFYETLSRKKLNELIASDYDGYRFWQYADFIYDLKHHAKLLPDSGTNDGALFYKSNPYQMYNGQGAPIVREQYEINYIETAHMRSVIPPSVEYIDYFYPRTWYHYYAPDQIMEFDRIEGKRLTQIQVHKKTMEECLDNLKNLKNFKNSNIENDIICKLGTLNDDRAPKDIPLILKVGIKKYIENN